MWNKYERFLEDIKLGIDVSKSESSIDIVQSIIAWYSCLFGKCNDIDKAINLFYYFYIHENLELYDIDEYGKQCNYLFQTYLLPREKVIDAIVSFRSLVNGD